MTRIEQSLAAALLAVLVLAAGMAWAGRTPEPAPETIRSRWWIVHLPQELASARPPRDWGAAADGRIERLRDRLGVAPPAEPLHAWLYDSPSALRKAAGDDKPFLLQTGRREVHHLVAPDGRVTDPAGDALLVLHLAWGAPGSERLARAIAHCALDDVHGRPVARYAARIAKEEEPWPLQEVLGLGPETPALRSPLVADAFAAAWVESLRAGKGPGAIRKLWSAPLAPGSEEALAQALRASWKELESGWQTWIAGQPAPAEREAIPHALGFLRGISFSHEVGGGFGYGSDIAREQLARIRALGANAVAIVPYAFTRAPAEPTIRYRGVDESDARVVRSIRQAQQLGLKVILKPQLWTRGVFTGHLVFANEKDFALWFEGYRRWMLHHARLAQLERVDLLVIGTELGGLTRHQAAWRGLIRDLRRVYSGPLTYAANWADDFEVMPFWDALDVLGLNMYYPLAAPGEKPSAGSTRLRELRAKLAGISRRHRKPILFTEVGYAASAAAAVEPWKEDNAPLDPAMQARCYEVVFRAFYREPWLAGLFWWKWPSHGRGDPQDESFSPLGKPAFEVLKGWYGRKR